MARMVLLHHTLPDGASHYDWMIEPPATKPRSTPADLDPGTRDLLTFRVDDRMDDPRATRFPATRLEEHRRLYLNFEGDIGPASGNPAGPSRGLVKRVAQGAVSQVHAPANGVLEIHGCFERQSPCIWRGKVEQSPAGPVWRFVCTAAPSRQHASD